MRFVFWMRYVFWIGFCVLTGLLLGNLTVLAQGNPLTTADYWQTGLWVVVLMIQVAPREAPNARHP